MRYLLQVRIAGKTAIISTRHRTTAEFFRAYVDETPGTDAPYISVSPEEIASKRQVFIHTGDPAGLSLSDAGIERLLIHTRLTEYLLQHDILLLHGSAVSMDGGCYLFTAPSGTGKSTHAGLWREAFGERCFSINDDKPYLICREDAVTVCGSPWNGKHGYGRNTSAPLKAIGFLHQSEGNRTERISPAEAFGILYQQTYRPAAADGQITVLMLLKRLAQQTAFYHIYCNMDPEAAMISYAGMQ